MLLLVVSFELKKLFIVCCCVMLVDCCVECRVLCGVRCLLFVVFSWLIVGHGLMSVMC